jgi:hypothetical protein
VRTENSDSDVLVMKPADQGMRHDATDPLNRAHLEHPLSGPGIASALRDINSVKNKRL